LVQKISYAGRNLKYRTFDSAATEVLRLNFRPARITSGDIALTERADLKDEGYTLQALSGGDFVVRVRHAKSNEIGVAGK
jgi:hypothetical protein